MPTRPRAAAILLAAPLCLLAACASGTPSPPAEASSPAGATGVATAPTSPDSVESICTRGDTTALLLRSRRTGKRRLERWLFTPRGGVIDLATGRQLMDSAHAARTGIRELFREQQALDARAAALSSTTGKTLCR